MNLRPNLKWIAPALLVGAAPLSSCSRPMPSTCPASEPPPALKDAFRGAFRVGVAVNTAQLQGRDARGAEIVRRQFNAISPENLLKWSEVHPEPNRWTFNAADRYVAFGEENGMFIVGHTLVWHQQVPGWVFAEPGGRALDRDSLLGRMREHIAAVVGRYRGRIHGWDVVNEAIDDDGALRRTPWLDVIGDDYIAKAFEFAHQADPGAELYYNDFSLESPPKREGALALVRRLLAAGAPIAGVGLQHHDRLDWPSIDEVDRTIEEFGKLGVKVMVTELDVDVLPKAAEHQSADVSVKVAMDARLDPYARGLPDSVQQALADRYSDLFRAFLRHPGVLTRVTFWDVTDGDSWLNYWPVAGRTNHPLLFDRFGQPKPAFFAVVDAAKGAPPGQ